MQEFTTYILYFTVLCLVINFMLGKLRFLSLIWIYHLQKKTEPGKGISVIICSRNDVENLRKNLPAILAQDYPLYEVIVVDDASKDDTSQYLAEKSVQYPHLKTIRIDQKEHPGKKHALKLGIRQATYPFILLTDADCMPVSDQWISSHSKFLYKENTLLLGYGKYQKQKGFLNLLMRFDTVHIASNYMSMALWGRPYMGVGRNMGYSKELAGDLQQIDHTIASGDDDLFVQAVSKKANIAVNIEKESFTISPAKPDLKSWLHQKGRHTTTAPRYSLFIKIWLMIQWLVSVGFYAGFIMILLTGKPVVAGMLFLLNSLSIALFNGLWVSKLGEKGMILLTPFLDFIYTFVQPIFVVKSWGRKKEEWN